MRMVIQPSSMPLADKLGEYRHYGTLFWFLARRDIQLRYRQTMLGIVWAVLQPLLPMLIFVAVFARLLKLETGEIPYPLFVLSGLAPWTFVANAVNSASPTFVNNYSLLNKVYFPRAILPAAAVAAAALDGLVGGVVVLAVSLWYGVGPSLWWLLIPLPAGATAALAMAAGVTVASLTAVFRDVKNVVPFLVQVWMFSTPVFYPVQLVPGSLRPLAGFNPMTGILEAFRSCLLGAAPDWLLVGQSAVATVILAAVALGVFDALEADLAERV
jgi:lipopolysaccharide transport system permease protein